MLLTAKFEPSTKIRILENAYIVSPRFDSFLLMSHMCLTVRLSLESFDIAIFQHVLSGPIFCK